MADHKIVCWGDYAIPVPVWANWIAMDKDCSWYCFAEKPNAGDSFWLNNIGPYGITSNYIKIPPEPGPWNEQLYWIGDDDD